MIFIICCWYLCIYTLVLPLKYTIAITKVFQEILDEYWYKPDKVWVDKGREFYNKSMKSWLQDNDAEIYSTHNEGKFINAERFIRILKNETYKY